jgi:hypothetical protein
MPTAPTLSANLLRWARVLPKKDDKFDQVITHLKTTKLAEISSKYAQVRIQVVNYQLNAFRGIAASVSNVQASSSLTTVDGNYFMDENLYINNYAFTGVPSDDPMLNIVDDWESSFQWE